MPGSVTFSPTTVTAGQQTTLPADVQDFLDSAQVLVQTTNEIDAQVTTALTPSPTSSDVPGALPSSSAPASNAAIQPSTSPTNSQVDQSVLFQQYVQTPARPDEYQGLMTDPSISIQYESNLAPQVEGSDALLRKLSPFVMRVELPLVYANLTGYKNNSISVNVFSNAQQSVQGYDNARTTLARTGLGVMSGTAQSPQEYIASGSATAATRGNRTGGQAQDTRSTGKLGEPAIADFMAAVDIARQLSAVLNAPPLTLLINPTSMRISYTKLQNYSDRTRYGYLHHEWGDEQVKINITARCGAFYSGGRGVQYASKRDSVAWQNLMNLFTFYKNNGYIYDTLGQSYAHHFVGALSIHYDQWIYYGNMDNFSWTYDEQNQLGGIEFTISFVASGITDTAQPTVVVQPMNSPTLNPGDPKFYGMGSVSQNQPGVFSVGVDGSGQFRVVTQGRPVGAVTALNTLIPGSLTNLGAGTVTPGTGGFSSPTPAVQSGQRTVFVATPVGVTPFGG